MKKTLANAWLIYVSSVALGASSIGCRKESEVSDIGGPIVVKHQTQTINANGWKVERWVHTVGGYVTYPVDVSIRITPLNEETKKLPKVMANLKLNHKDPKFSRKATVEVEFQDCSKMPKRVEYSRWGTKTGELEDFPPKALCWEATIKDPFKSSAQSGADTTRLEAGEYRLDVAVSLEAVDPFEFSPITMKFFLNRGDAERNKD